MLQGPHISVVQSEALSILNFLDEIAKYQRANEDFRLNLISRPEYNPVEIFPDYFNRTTTTTDEDVDGDDVEYDYSAVEWKGPSDVDKEELDKILGMLQQAQGKVDMEQTDKRSQGEWV